MKLVEMRCKNCGAMFNADSDDKEVKCSYCQTSFKIDDEVQHHQLDNAQQIGYEMEKGKIRARKEAEEEIIRQYNAGINIQKEAERKKKNLTWWVLGWIFCFPIPLTILIWKSKWDKKKKIIVTTILWIVLCIIGLATPNDTTNTQENDFNRTVAS